MTAEARAKAVQRCEDEVARLTVAMAVLDARKASLIGNLAYQKRLLAHYRSAPVRAEVEDQLTLTDALAVGLGLGLTTPQRWVTGAEPARSLELYGNTVQEVPATTDLAGDLVDSAARSAVADAAQIAQLPNSGPVMLRSDGVVDGVVLDPGDEEFAEIMGEFRPTAERPAGRRTPEERLQRAGRSA